MTTNGAALTTEFLTRLRAFVRRRVRSAHDAEDIVQDVLTKFVQHDDAISAGSVYAWLFTVARRTIIDRARTSGSTPAGDSIDSIAIIDLADDPSASSELARCMEPMLESLGREDRRILQRIDMLGESQADVARELGLSMSGLKSRVQRARRRLRAHLEACCAIDRDGTGRPIDTRRRPDRPCPCDGCG
ncbi:MAG: sigma-70 family RNA polymerase sigma factor [Phycisphaeraceae bacterium]|nr:sigma-70 family RNA polymerase sigma factor [Phycisphaeraceae bacterium]